MQLNIREVFEMTGIPTQTPKNVNLPSKNDEWVFLNACAVFRSSKEPNRSIKVYKIWMQHNVFLVETYPVVREKMFFYLRLVKSLASIDLMWIFHIVLTIKQSGGRRKTSGEVFGWNMLSSLLIFIFISLFYYVIIFVQQFGAVLTCF